MTRAARIYALVRKELLCEKRQQYSFIGILLYVAATSFVLYLAIGNPEKKVWNGLFWVIQLFVCVNAVAKSFLQESRGRLLYYYSLNSAADFILSKLIFNALLMVVMSLASWALVQLLMGSPVEKPGLFFFVAVWGAISLSLVFTLLSAIAAKARQNAALMAILGFPLIMPLVLVLIKTSTVALSAGNTPLPWALMGILIGYDVLIILLSLILFPFIWKD
jgi:heme exporter protein B